MTTLITMKMTMMLLLMMIMMMMFMKDVDEDEFDDDDANKKYDDGSYVNNSMFSNIFDKDVILTTNMFVETLSQYNDDHVVVIM